MVTARITPDSLALKSSCNQARLSRAPQKRRVQKSGRTHLIRNLSQLLMLCSCAIAALGACAFLAAQILSSVFQSTLMGAMAVIAVMLVPMALTAWHSLSPARIDSLGYH